MILYNDTVGFGTHAAAPAPELNLGLGRENVAGACEGDLEATAVIIGEARRPGRAVTAAANHERVGSLSGVCARAAKLELVVGNAIDCGAPCRDELRRAEPLNIRGSRGADGGAGSESARTALAGLEIFVVVETRRGAAVAGARTSVAALRPIVSATELERRCARPALACSTLNVGGTLQCRQWCGLGGGSKGKSGRQKADQR